jgi:hypothetical protein
MARGALQYPFKLPIPLFVHYPIIPHFHYTVVLQNIGIRRWGMGKKNNGGGIITMSQILLFDFSRNLICIEDSLRLGDNGGIPRTTT